MYLDDMKIIENEAYYKSILLELYEKLLKNKRGNVASCFRKTICRLDEVLLVINYEDIIQMSNRESVMAKGIIYLMTTVFLVLSRLARQEMSSLKIE